jgi:hypothetical protein
LIKKNFEVPLLLHTFFKISKPIPKEEACLKNFRDKTVFFHLNIIGIFMKPWVERRKMQRSVRRRS